jgi:hypothetical protein
MLFNIPQQDGSSIIVPIQKPFVNMIDVSERKTTIKGDLLLIIHVFLIGYRMSRKMQKDW